MNVIAGIAAIAFGLLHGLPAIAQLGAAQTPRGSGTPAAVPRWARVLWIDLAIVTIVAGVLLIAGRGSAASIVTAVGVAGLVVLAVANGVWIHGRPTVSHHVVRAAVAAAILALAFLAA